MDKLSKLYMENYCIMKENERLRRAADLLDQENRALLNELKQRLASAAAAGIPIPDLNLSAAGIPMVDLNLSTSTSTSATTSSSSSKTSKTSKK